MSIHPQSQVVGLSDVLNIAHWTRNGIDDPLRIAICITIPTLESASIASTGDGIVTYHHITKTALVGGGVLVAWGRGIGLQWRTGSKKSTCPMAKGGIQFWGHSY